MQTRQLAAAIPRRGRSRIPASFLGIDGLEDLMGEEDPVALLSGRFPMELEVTRNDVSGYGDVLRFYLDSG